MSGQASAPGWYPDPWGSGGTRWWDGNAWTEQLALPAARGARPRPSRFEILMGAAVLAVTAVVIAAFVVAGGDGPHSAALHPTSGYRPNSETSSTAAPADRSTVPPSLPAYVPPSLPAYVPPASPPTAMPTNGSSAVIDVDTSARMLTLETNLQDTRYAACASFQARSVTGSALGLSGLQAGDFAVVQIDPSVPCVSRVSVSTPPQPPACAASGYGGGAGVVWVGYNETAHSVLYRPTGPNEPVLTARWCQTPTVASNGSATSLSQIAPGAMVELQLSNDDWVTSVTIDG